VQVIDPERLEGNTLPPPVHIEQLIADRKTFVPQAGMRLPPLTRDLEIDYTGLSFVVPRKTLFRYRLEGHDAGWQDAGARRQAFYTDLPPGDYRFRVMASNNDRVWNESGASLEFAITPAFYQTRWFAGLCIAGAVGALWLLFRLRVRQIEMRMRMRLEERLVERERIARELHDTLLQGLLSASLQLSVANSTIPSNAAAKPLVEKILQLLRRVVDEGRDAVRGLRTRDSEQEALERAFAQIPQDLAADRKIEYRLIVEGAPRTLQPLVREEVYRIGREALANAFRHSQGSVVETVLEYSRNQFRIVIRDNGCGMDPQVVRAGREGHWGLSGIRERAEMIGARLKVLSAAGAGTEIDLIVPGGAAFEPATARRWMEWLPGFYRRREQEA
jgi:signal transduction histidine kinase